MECKHFHNMCCVPIQRLIRFEIYSIMIICNKIPHHTQGIICFLLFCFVISLGELPEEQTRMMSRFQGVWLLGLKTRHFIGFRIRYFNLFICSNDFMIRLGMGERE